MITEELDDRRFSRAFKRLLVGPWYPVLRGRSKLLGVLLDGAKRFRNVEKATILLWKLLMVAEKRWRRLNDPERLVAVWQGQRFVNGEPVATPVSTVEVAR